MPSGIRFFSERSCPFLGSARDSRVKIPGKLPSLAPPPLQDGCCAQGKRTGGEHRGKYLQMRHPDLEKLIFNTDDHTVSFPTELATQQ